MTSSLGSLASLHRNPVRSVMGEALNAAYVTPRGLFGGRSYTLHDSETGKVLSAKNPRNWPNLFSYDATYMSPPVAGSVVPSVRVTLPDGGFAVRSSPDFAPTLSATLGRAVTMRATPPQNARLEEYWPEMTELAIRDVVTERGMPAGTFFDLAALHVSTTGSLDKLRQLNPRSRFEPRRFRPSLIVETGGQDGFIEDDWIGKTLAIGPEVRIRLTGPCPRCMMTTLSQADLPADSAILKTVAHHNEARVGANASVVQPGTIRVGGPLTTL